VLFTSTPVESQRSPVTVDVSAPRPSAELLRETSRFVRSACWLAPTRRSDGSDTTLAGLRFLRRGFELVQAQHSETAAHRHIDRDWGCEQRSSV
jgi:hypothetical protein